MHPQIDAIFDDAEARYLKPEELNVMTQYVQSLPDRVTAYRNLRDQELEVMQWVADELQAQMPQEEQALLERSIKNALLMLRCCSMAMLLNDEALITKRFLEWVSQSAKVYNTGQIDTRLYQLLDKRLAKILGSQQMRYLSPMLATAQKALLSQPEPVNGAAIGW